MNKSEKICKVKAQRILFPTSDKILIYSKCGTIPPTELPNTGALNMAIGDREKAYFECRVDGERLELLRQLRRQNW